MIDIDKYPVRLPKTDPDGDRAWRLTMDLREIRYREDDENFHVPYFESEDKAREAIDAWSLLRLHMLMNPKRVSTAHAIASLWLRLVNKIKSILRLS